MLDAPVPHQQVLVGAPVTLSMQFADADGEPADGGTVTVGVVDAAGTTVVAAGTATVGTGTEPRTYALASAATDALALLTATWTSSTHGVRTTLLEIVGGYWFTTAQARARDRKLADAAKYPPGLMLAVRAEVEREFESVTNQAWVPRYRRASVDGTGTCELVAPDVELRSVRSVRRYEADGVTYTAFTAAELAALEVTRWGTIIRRDGTWFTRGARHVFEYEHGHDAPPPDLRDAAITRLRHRMNAHSSGIPDRATSMQTEAGQTFSLATPGLRGFITGIPDVDVVLDRYRFPEFGVA
jgi:hypothetical protein